MALTNISIRVDEDVKRNAEIICDKIGLTLSAVTNVFYRQFIRVQGIPFPVTATEPLNDAGFLLRKSLREAQEHVEKNGLSDMSLDEINELISEARLESADKK